MIEKSMTRPQAATAPPANKDRILIIDDEPNFRSAYQKLLHLNERIIDDARNGFEAIKKLKQVNYDLVILDLSLPDISGFDIIDWIKSNKLDVQIIVFSANKSIESAISALRHRVFDFFKKDCDPDEFLINVNRALDYRKKEKKHVILTEKLKSSERLHRFLVENSPDIIFNIDRNGFFTFINGRAKSMLGYESSDLIGKHYSHIVAPDDWKSVHYIFNERRTDHQGSTNQEVNFRVNPELLKQTQESFVTTILSTQGIYSISEDGLHSEFIGTSGVARDISERKRAEETILFQAFHDILTKLPNRNLFKDRLEMALAQAARRQEKLAVMFFDLDRFKLVNDTYGHAVGDHLLKEFSSRIRKCLRSGDTLARQGGDEFTALLPAISHSSDPNLIAEKIMAELRKPFCVADTQFLATTSIGIAIYPEHGQHSLELLRCADMAMYQVKGQGKNGYATFQPHMQTTHSNRISIENDLREAVKSGDQFEIYFQPQIDSTNTKTIGLEVLIRWHHPKEGTISPDIFIPIAEETGLIVAISDWVLWKACAQFDSLRTQGLGDLRLGINLSPKEFERSDFLDRIHSPLEKYSINPEYLDIEITESLLMKDVESIVQRVQQLRNSGFNISIDDFGTRYSSLNYLRRFSVNRIKIDQSFVQDLGSSKEAYAIIQAIVGIANNFNLGVMAEGVETEEQLTTLRQLGCHEMQGFFFSKPLTFDKTIEFLQTKRPASSPPLLHSEVGLIC